MAVIVVGLWQKIYIYNINTVVLECYVQSDLDIFIIIINGAGLSTY